MSVTKNVFTLKKAYELIVDKKWATYDPFDNFVVGDLYQSGVYTGLDTTSGFSSPTQLPGCWYTHRSQVRSMFVTKCDGTLWVWGCNYAGLLGLNNLTGYSSPVQLPGTNWTSVVSTYCFTLGLKGDGTLWAWGCGQYGRLGLNCNVNRSSPTQIPGTNWTGVMAGPRLGMGLKSDGTLWVWSRGAVGSLGLNQPTNNYLSSPVQLPGNNWVDVNARNYSVFGLKSDSTLWGWGCNYSGQLGIERTSNGCSSPSQVPGNNWKAAAISSIGIALKNDGTLWTMGPHQFGGTGVNETVGCTNNSPAQIPGTNWSRITTRFASAAAVKTDGTLWSWGYNGGSNLGLNDNTNRSSPTQVPGTNWKDVHMAISTTSFYR